VRLLSIGGHAGKYLDRLSLTFLENYQESTLIDGGAFAILDFKHDNQTVEIATSSRLLTLQAYEQVTTKLNEFTMSASAEVEYFSKVSVSTGLKISNSSTDTFKNEIQKESLASEKTTTVLGSGEILVFVARINVMKDDAGKTWFYPVDEPSWVLKKKSEYAQLAGYYDLTSGLSTQMSLTTVAKNGLNVLGAPAMAA
jgi:hypothetical protein